MSVPNQTPYIIYNANGLTTVFPFEFYIINTGDIQISINGTVVTSGYTVSGVGNIGGGDVIFLTPPANGSVVMLERVVPTYRLTDYQDNGDLLADTVNKDFDRLWMAIQRSFIYLGLALRRPILGGPFDAEGYRISKLADPINDGDAVNKGWVDRTYKDVLQQAKDAADRAEDAADRAEDAVEHGITNLLNVASVKALLTTVQLTAVSFNVLGYVPGTDFGGGIFYWDPDKPKSQHNGITIFSPTVPWDGSYAGLVAFLAGTGETDGSGSGCWMRSKKGDIMASWAGFDVTGNQVADDIIKAACILAANTRRCLRIDPGSTVKWGFTHLTQYHDKFNLNRQTSVVLDGISGLTVYADQDVEFNTDHPTYRERVVFGIFNGKNNTFKGFNWNSDFTDYSISPTDTEHKIQEHWKGFVFEGCSDNSARGNNVNACHVFALADNINLSTNLQNKSIQVIENKFKYVVNYCFLSRALEWYVFDRNEVAFQGRKWHTYGEAAAPTTQTKHIRVCDNKFTDQIAQQSCITPGPHIESGLISGNYCKRHYGIFIENGSSSNLLIENNTSISTGERADTTHILLVGEVDDQPTGNSPHSNVLIQGNMFIGGGFAVQEYNTGIALRYGFSILNNHMVDCKMPAITNQSFIGIRLEGNYMHAPDNFPDLAIAGQYPVIQNNTLIGVRIRARELGYVILSPKVVNNKFQANGLNEKFPAIIDFTDFSGLVAEGNDITAANYENFIVHPINCNVAGFKRIGQTEGFIEKPTTRYGSKLICQLGDIVMNREPSPTNNKYAWVCVDGANKTFGDLNIGI